MARVAIIDYGMGNLYSIQTALQFLDADVVCTNDLHLIKMSDKIILPGVGSFRMAMENICRLGLDVILRDECIVKISLYWVFA